MWYFTWILGLGLALGFGIINALWLEASYAFGQLDEEATRDRFESRSQNGAERPRRKPPTHFR